MAIQLPPTVDRWRPWATVVAGARVDVGVVLVHQLGSNRREWKPLVERLARGPNAVTTLAVDLRGHGDSVRGPRDEVVRWSSFGTDPVRWMGTAYDVLAAVSYLRAQGAARVVLVGSGIGATAVLLAATGTFPPGAPSFVPPEVQGLVLFSPGLAYRGVDIRGPRDLWLSWGRPLLALAGERDGPSVEAVSLLTPTNLPHLQREVFPLAHERGVALCNALPERWAVVERWIRQVLASTPGSSSRDAAVDDRSEPGP